MYTRVPTLCPQSCQSREKHRRPMDRYGAVERLTRPDDDEGRGIPSSVFFLLFGFVLLTVSLTLHHPLHHHLEHVAAAHPPPPPPPQRKQWTVPTVYNTIYAHIISCTYNTIITRLCLLHSLTLCLFESERERERTLLLFLTRCRPSFFFLVQVYHPARHRHDYIII